jgi:hypothetical protein
LAEEWEGMENMRGNRKENLKVSVKGKRREARKAKADILWGKADA